MSHQLLGLIVRGIHQLHDRQRVVDRDHRGVRAEMRRDELIHLQLQRQGVFALRTLDQEHHQEGDDVSERIDDQLPANQEPDRMKRVGSLAARCRGPSHFWHNGSLQLNPFIELSGPSKAWAMPIGVRPRGPAFDCQVPPQQKA